MNTFPIHTKEEKDTNPANEIFGLRFYRDQSLYEYLIEFLLIFCSPKSDNLSDNKMKFHDRNIDLQYYAETKIGLKRFIFYADSKKNTSIAKDEEAYNAMVKYLRSKINDDDDEYAEKIISHIQDMLRGYGIVIKKRTWCAQQILPLCPELVFCEAQPNQKHRLKVVDSANDISIDSSFEFTQHNFISRGGELYYLHLLQYLLNNQEKKEVLEKQITYLLTSQSISLSKLTRMIQDSWIEYLQVDDDEKDKLYQKYLLGYIPSEAYVECEEYAVDELISFLSCDIELLKKIELFATGVMLQVLRMMSYALAEHSHKSRKPWIVDMTNNNSDTIKKLSVQSLRDVEDQFYSEISEAAKNMGKGLSENEILTKMTKGYKQSIMAFRARAKDLRLIIPFKGANERFSLSENVVRFLVTSLIEPGDKVTLDTFLNELYKHYDIVIGPVEYKQCDVNNSDSNLTNSFNENKKCFEQFLKSTGFLKELSDTTSIVFNPYYKVEGDE